jgi:hypothetical protein
MKRLSSLAVLLLAAAPCFALDPAQVFEKVSPSVWIVRTYDASERAIGQGSAVVVAAGQLVTNCHVLAKAKSVIVRRRNVMYEAKLQHADAPRDLCLLSVAEFNAPAVVIAPIESIKVGEKVYAIGNPAGLEVTLSEGLISGLRGEWPDGSHVLQTTAPIAPGSSGGGLFDAEGRLVGITTLYSKTLQNINFAMPAEWIADVPARAEAALAKRNPVAQPGATPAAARSAAIPGYPASGTTWVYRVTEQRFGTRKTEVQVRAERVDSDTVDEVIYRVGQASSLVRRIVAAHEQTFMQYSLGRDGILLEFAPYLLTGKAAGEPPGELAPSGYSAPIESVGAPPRVEWTNRAKLGEWEEVTVPAGTYRALRYEIEGTRFPRPVGNGTVRAISDFKLKVWYAPDIGRMVKLEHQTFSSSLPEGSDLVELVEYRPPQ